MTTKGSFYQGSTVYTDTNPAGPADAPLPNTVNPAPTSFYKSTGPILTSMMEAGFEIALSIAGPPFLNSEWLAGYKFDFAGVFAANFAGSQATAANAATGAPVFSIKLNGVQVGTLTYSGAVGTFSSAQINVAVGDFLELVAPASPDATVSHLAITLFGTRI